MLWKDKVRLPYKLFVEGLLHSANFLAAEARNSQVPASFLLAAILPLFIYFLPALQVAFAVPRDWPHDCLVSGKLHGVLSQRKQIRKFSSEGLKMSCNLSLWLKWLAYLNGNYEAWVSSAEQFLIYHGIKFKVIVEVRIYYSTNINIRWNL